MVDVCDVVVGVVGVELVTVHAPGWGLPGLVDVVVVVGAGVVVIGLIVVGIVGVVVGSVVVVIVTVWPCPTDTLTPTGVVLVEVEVGAVETAVVTVGAVVTGVVVVAVAPLVADDVLTG